MSTILERSTKCCGDPEDGGTNTAWGGKENANGRDDLLSGILEKDLKTLLVYQVVKDNSKSGISTEKSKCQVRAEKAGVSGCFGRRQEV